MDYFQFIILLVISGKEVPFPSIRANVSIRINTVIEMDVNTGYEQ